MQLLSNMLLSIGQSMQTMISLLNFKGQLLRTIVLEIAQSWLHAFGLCLWRGFKVFLSMMCICDSLHGGGQRVSTRGCDGSSRDAGSSCLTLGMDQTRRPVTCSPAVSYIPMVAAQEANEKALLQSVHCHYLKTLPLLSSWVSSA